MALESAGTVPFHFNMRKGRKTQESGAFCLSLTVMESLSDGLWVKHLLFYKTFHSLVD